MTLTKNDYLKFRRKYEPKHVKLVLIAESPPKNQTYFYNPNGSHKEWLFRAVMEQLGHAPQTKEAGLREMQRRGWVLVDATYEPVDGLGRQNKRRDGIILRDYPLLAATLSELSPNKSVPIILIKANVCKLLDDKLTADGFKVINKGVSVPFPSHGQQPKFHAQFALLLTATVP
jgi:hypothetical protein